MTDYQLRICDLRSDDDLDRLDISGVTYDDYIGKTGSLQGTVTISNRDLAQRAKAALIPGRTMLYLEQSTIFGTETVWGGILWTRTPTADARGMLTLPIQAGALEGYFRSHRLLVDTMTYAGMDQLEIARQLIYWAQSQSGGNLNIEVDYSQVSGVLRDRTYSRYDLPWIGGLVDQLAAVDGGFEWRIQCYADATGQTHRALRLGYPKLTVGVSDVVIDSPGAIRGYALPEDATLMANAWQSRGASINQNQAAASVPLMSPLLTSPTDIAAGWPRMDGTSDYSTIDVQATLDAHAAADLARSRMPVVIPSVSYKSGDRIQPQLGSFVRLRIQDDWYTELHSARYRVVGLKATPEERGRPDSTALYLEAA